MANLKNITELPVVESAEGLNLIVNDNGFAKQIAASAIGGVSSWNDIEDKPFSEEKVTVNEPLNITWDGNTEGLVVTEGNPVGYKVSDWVPSDEQLKLCTVTMTDDAPTLNLGEIWNTDEGNGFVQVTEDYTMAYMVISVRTDGAKLSVDAGEIVFPEKGLYFFANPPMHVVSLTSTEPVEHVKTVVHTIDTKYLPEALQFGEEENELLYVETQSAYYMSYCDVKLVEGQHYIIEVDGIRYDCVAEIIDGCVAIDCADGEFFIACGSDRGGDFISFDSYDARTYRISAIEAKKIDVKYLPDDIGGDYTVVIEMTDDGTSLVAGSFQGIVETLRNGKTPKVVMRRAEVGTGYTYFQYEEYTCGAIADYGDEGYATFYSLGRCCPPEISINSDNIVDYPRED